MKKVILLLIVIAMSFMLLSCSASVNAAPIIDDDITIVKEESNLAAGTDYMIIADKSTGVMYLVLRADLHLYSRGTTSITPLYNADGSLRIYED